MKERKVLFGEIEPGPFAEVVDVLVERRQARVLETVSSNPMVRLGRLEGLDMCKQMRNGEVIDFDLALLDLSSRCKATHIAYKAGEATRDVCIRHTAAQREVEYCYNVLRVAHCAFYGAFYEERYGYPPKQLLETEHEEYLAAAEQAEVVLP